MGLMDAFKENGTKQQQNQIQGNEAVKIAIQQTCSNLTQYCRDANLPYEIVHKYRKGMIIKEKGFVDATALSGGVVTNHRYIILSNHMVPLIQFEGDKKWALCVANRDSYFLVLGKAEGKGKRVTVLLHLNNDTWRLFKSINMSIFQNLLNDCYNSFKECIFKEPIVSVSTDEWLARCKFPVGMNDYGEFFPIEDDNDAYSVEKGDVFAPKACVSGLHEFTTIAVHEAQCTPTMPIIHYVCKKCGARYYGITPERYGVVIDKDL